MKRMYPFVLIILALSLPAAEAPWQRLLIAGYKLGYLAILDRSGEMIWRMDTKAKICDAWMLADGRIIFSDSSKGTRIIQPDYLHGGGEEVWHRPVPEDCETHSCQPLGSDRFLIGESLEGVSHLVEVDLNGSEFHRVSLEGIGGRHSTFRTVRKTPQGSYLLGAQGEGYSGRRAIEVDAEGRILQRYPGGGWLGVRLPDGGTLFSSGSGHWGESIAKVFQMDAAGEITWRYDGEKLPAGMQLGFPCGLQRLPNGNTLICNGRFNMGRDANPGPAVIEVDPQGQLVWQAPETIENLVTIAMVVDLQPPQENQHLSQGLDTPESVCPHPEGSGYLVSNIGTSSEGYWEDDGEGFISLIDNNGDMIEPRWFDDGLNAPKGLCCLDGHLYIADNRRVLRVSLADRSASTLPFPELQQANDLLAADGRVWLSDSGAGKVYVYDPSNDSIDTIPAPDGVNGLAWQDGHLFAVSWTEHDLYELDPDGNRAPRALGLAEHFQTLDGIQVMADGGFLVSDCLGGAVHRIPPTRDTSRVLLEITGPADLCLHDGRLLVPQVLENDLCLYAPLSGPEMFHQLR